MQLTFKVPAGASYVDLALAASIANRRGYKQENTKWAVASFEFFQSAGLDAGTVSIQKLPETWVLDNAYALRCLFVIGSVEAQFITQTQLEIELGEGARK